MTNNSPQNSLCASVMPSPLVSASQALASCGVELPAFEELRFNPAHLNQSQLRIPAFLSRYLWELLGARSGRQDFGLIAAKHSAPHQLFGLFYLMQLKVSRMAALDTLLSYIPLVASHMQLRLSIEGNLARLGLSSVNHMCLADNEVDYWMASLIHHLNTPAPSQPVVMSAHFRRPTPNNVQPWITLIQAPVNFSAPADELWLDVRVLTKAKQGGSATVLKALHQALDGYATSPPEPSLLEKVADLIILNLNHSISQEMVAETLHLTPRTLHRMLERDGWSYREILDRHRRYLSYDLLIRSSSDPGTVADLLGYRETSSFQRAFERWHGST